MNNRLAFLNNNAMRGRLLVVAAAVLWSTSGIYAKSPVFESWPLAERGVMFAFWRSLFAAAILACLVRRISWSWRLLVSGLTFAFMNVTYLSAMVYCEVGLAIWLQYTSPIWVLLMGYLFLGERPPRSDAGIWLLIICGILVILLGQPGHASGWGISLGLLSGIGFAGVVVAIRWMRDIDPAWVVFVNHFFTAVVLLPVMVRQGIWPQADQWGMLAAFGVLQMGLPYVLFAWALRSIDSNEASGLTLLEPLFGPLWVLIFYSSVASYEPPSWGTLLGGGLILLGLTIRYWRLARHRKTTDSK
jgi:drug/metabolite transporter, DME family